MSTDLTFARLLEIKSSLFDLPRPRFDTIVGSLNLRRRADPEEFVDFGQKDRAAPVSIAGLRYQQVPAEFAPRMPVLQISSGFEHCSPEFRAAWNAWALERFGTQECAILMDSSTAQIIFTDIQKAMDRRLENALLGAVVVRGLA